MFKHILFPTDGSASSDIAAQSAMRFAKSIGAKITALHVLPAISPDCRAPGSQDTAAKCLLTVQHAAAEQGVPCDTLVARADDVHLAIVQAAFDKQCDLVVMSSRGLSDAPQSPPGSQTLRVLTHTQVPVLVFR
ncbi:MAG: universal stress protein [Massilia sp.]|nr:universal stress protein [Massilia sp.]